MHWQNFAEISKLPPVYGSSDVAHLYRLLKEEENSILIAFRAV